jgi:hypothetical protein
MTAVLVALACCTKPLAGTFCLDDDDRKAWAARLLELGLLVGEGCRRPIEPEAGTSAPHHRADTRRSRGPTAPMPASSTARKIQKPNVHRRHTSGSPAPAIAAQRSSTSKKQAAPPLPSHTLTTDSELPQCSKQYVLRRVRPPHVTTTAVTSGCVLVFSSSWALAATPTGGVLPRSTSRLIRSTVSGLIAIAKRSVAHAPTRRQAHETQDQLDIAKSATAASTIVR